MIKNHILSVSKSKLFLFYKSLLDLARQNFSKRKMGRVFCVIHEICQLLLNSSLLIDNITGFCLVNYYSTHDLAMSGENIFLQYHRLRRNDTFQQDESTCFRISQRHAAIKICLSPNYSHKAWLFIKSD